MERRRGRPARAEEESKKDKWSECVSGAFAHEKEAPAKPYAHPRSTSFSAEQQKDLCVKRMFLSIKPLVSLVFSALLPFGFSRPSQPPSQATNPTRHQKTGRKVRKAEGKLEKHEALVAIFFVRYAFKPCQVLRLKEKR